jgi:hypothetical protein
MDTARIALVVLAVAILGIVGWLAVRTTEEAISLASGWEILLGDPVIVGDLADPFVYAGGAAVRAVEGDGRIRFSEGTGRGVVRATVRLDGSAAVLVEGEPPSGELILRSRTSEASTVETDVVVHGESGRGEPGLPETSALLFGAGPFELTLDGTPVRADATAVWSVARALRREDGAIRNRGLVFSPLLRDDTVFADPDRLEGTILVYAPSDDGGRRIILHVVFRSVEIVDAPPGVSPSG